MQSLGKVVPLHAIFIDGIVLFKKRSDAHMALVAQLPNCLGMGFKLLIYLYWPAAMLASIFL